MLDITNHRFHNLVAIKIVGKKPTRWLFLCDCGNITESIITNVTQGRTKSCGCLRKANSKKHGMWGTSTYRIWNAMIQRCENPKNPYYAYYGGRGIKVHNAWKNFACFLKDVGERPSGLTLDRIDNNGNYTPSNVRWVSRRTQSRNTRATRYYTHEGECLCLDDWAERLEVSRELLRGRLRRGAAISDIVKEFS